MGAETNSSRGIHVLYVDDDKSLLEATQTYLEERFEELSVETTASAVDALDRLTDEEFDVVVSDYQMPEMDGLDFLKQLRQERGNQIPFVIFTGKGREEVAMEALNLGANRYLQKGGDPMAQYGLLAQTIEQEAYHWRTRSALKQREEDLRITLDSIGDGVIATDTDGVVERMNVVAEELTGWDREDAVGKPLAEVFDIVDAKTGDSVESPVERVIEHESAFEFSEDTKLRSRDGTERYIADSAAPITNESDDVVGVVLIFRDITNRYLREQRQERQRQAVIDLATDEVLVNGKLQCAARRITETAAGTLDVDRSSIWLFDDTFDTLECLDLYDRSARDHETGMQLTVENYPSYFEALAGHRAIPATDARADARTAELCEPYLEPLGITSMLDATIRRGGQVVGVLCNETGGPKREWGEDEIRFAAELADQTVIALHNRDQRHRKEVLERTNQQLQFLFKQSPMAVIEWTLDFEVARWNDAAQELFGYTREEAAGQHAEFIVPHTSEDAVDAVWERLVDGEETEHIVNRNVTKSGAEIDCEWHNRAILDENGETVSVLSFVQDITEQRRQTWQLQAIAERTQDAIYIKDLEGRYEFINDAGARYFELAPQAVVGRTDRELFDLDEDLLAIDRWILEHEEPRAEMERHIIDGREHVFESEKYPHYDDAGRLVGIIGISRDVTDRAAVDDLLDAFHDTMTDASLASTERIELLIQTLHDSLEATSAQLCRVDQTANTHEVVVSLGDVNPPPVGRTVPLGDTLCEQVIADEGVVATYATDLAESNGGIPSAAPSVGSYVGAPVYVEESLWGVICFLDESETPTELTEDRCSMVELLANWLGHELAESRYEAELDRRDAVAHELAELLSERIAIPVRDAQAHTEEARQQEDLSSLEAATQALERSEALLDEALTLALSMTASETERVDLGALARTAWSELDQPTDRLVVTDGSLVVEANRRAVEQLFESIFEAVTTGGDGDCVVTLSHQNGRDGFVVAVDWETEDEGAAAHSVATRSQRSLDGLRAVGRMATANGWTMTLTEDGNDGVRIEFGDVVVE
ncbi:PAS domain-containing protein [Haloarchaeobius sp. TZWSO28]|uniref:PAS domain-containing protein n=1 Tax=Haloarchaeobius sp. TZWSO28 TaxID=3446119 RepID=UPI003EBFAC96